MATDEVRWCVVRELAGAKALEVAKKLPAKIARVRKVFMFLIDI